MSVAAAWWPPSPIPMATSLGCFRTDECRSLLLRSASSRHRASGDMMTTKTDTQSPVLQVAGQPDLIRVYGARVNNLRTSASRSRSDDSRCLPASPVRARARWCSRSPRSRSG